MLNNEAVSIRDDDKEEKFVVRLPNGMRARVCDAAKVSRRSMNAEIINRLESSLSQDLEITRLKAVIDVLLGKQIPKSNVIQLTDASQ